MIILVVPAVIIGIYGYRWTHRAAQVTAIIVGVTLVVMFVEAVNYGHLPASQKTWAAPSSGLFLAGVALLAIDMLTFGPFVSDYTRYLPKDVKGSSVFLSIFFGNAVATVATAALGAYIAALLPSLGTVSAVGKICGSWALVIMAFSLIFADTVNAYTGGFQILSLVSVFKRLSPSARVRIIPFLITMAVGLAVALVGYKSFVNNLSNFLAVLLLIFIPWSAVNLADYFVVRHGVYDVPSFFTPRGIYGKVIWQGLLAYAIGLCVEFPFISQVYYTGPFVKHLGGADISWIVGFVVAGGVYLLFARVWPVGAHTSAQAGGAEGGALPSTDGLLIPAELDATGADELRR